MLLGRMADNGSGTPTLLPAAPIPTMDPLLKLVQQYKQNYTNGGVNNTDIGGNVSPQFKAQLQQIVGELNHPVQQMPYNPNSPAPTYRDMPYKIPPPGSPSPYELVNEQIQGPDQLAQVAQERLAQTQAQHQAMIQDGGVGPLVPANKYQGPLGPHQVQSWVDQALHILGLPLDYAPGVENIIMHESSGNPNSINRWDTNAQEGHPSQGLMQTIPSTFESYALPGYNQNILNPIDNIIAGIRYAKSRYGLGMLMAGGRRTASGAYEGY